MDRVDNGTEGAGNSFIKGTILDHLWQQNLQEEMINIILAAGITPDDAIDNQVLLAIQSFITGSGTTIENIPTTENDTSKVLRPNGLLGVEWVTAASVVSGGLTSVQSFTSSGTWTRPAGITKILIKVIAAGGGGGRANSSGLATGGGGAGAGSYGEMFLDVSAVPTSSVTVGVAGAGATSGSPGATGGDSAFGAVIVAKGGIGGPSNTNGGIVFGGVGGAAPTTGHLSVAGADGQGAIDEGGDGAGSFYGDGALTILGRNTVGTSAKVPGAGGAGGRDTGSTENGGAGFRGLVIIEEYA